MKAWVWGLSAAALLGGALALGVAVGDGGKLAPGLRVAGVSVGGLTAGEAVTAVREHAVPPAVTVTAGGRTWTAPADTLGWQADPAQSVAAAQRASEARTFPERVAGFLGRAPAQDLPLVVRVDETRARAGLASLTGELNTAPKNAAILFDKTSRRYRVTPDTPGRRVDVEAGARAYAARPALATLPLTVTEWKAQHTAAELRPHADLGNRLIRPLTVELAGTSLGGSLTDMQVANLYWVRPEGIVLDDAQIAAVFGRLTGALDRPAQNARYAVRGGGLVKVPETAGFVVDRPAALRAFRAAVTNPGAASVVFAGKVSRPTLAVADLPDPAGLELIATGRSTYYHSSPARRQNVANAAARISGVVVPAGEDFSFLSALGGISPENGFVGGLIISGGRTVDGLGGGVCQVSTTTFRALYSAGLPVVERNSHSYRVGYYEPQVGFEAAVYDPGVDLRMKNDTGAPIYLTSVNDNARSTLEVQVWGRKPARTVKVSPAVILSRTPHPPAQYVPNAALRPGALKQVDWAQDGYKLYITRTIKDARGARTDRVSTEYKPWRAVYEFGPRG